MNKFVYPEFKQSYAWRAYFNALEQAMAVIDTENPGTFEHIFCEDSLLGKRLVDYDYEILDSTALSATRTQKLVKVFIDTQQRIAFGYPVDYDSTAKNRLHIQTSQDQDYWEYRQAPLQGVLYIKTDGVVEDLVIVESVGDYIDLWKADEAIRNKFFSPITIYTPDVLRRKLDSFYLLKWILQRQGYDYEVDMHNEIQIEFPVEEMLEILSGGTKATYRISKGDLRLRDTIKIGRREYPIRALSGDEIYTDLDLTPGLYTVVRRQQYAPISVTPPEQLLLIYLLERTNKKAIQQLLNRESPMRIGAQVVYFDLVLLASFKYGGKYDLPSLDNQLLMADFVRPYHFINSIHVGWKKDDTVEAYLCTNECSWYYVGDSEGRITVVPDESDIAQGQHWRIQRVIFKNNEFNRIFEELPYEVKFYGVNRHTGEITEFKFTVIVNEWDPTVAIVNVGEDLLITTESHHARLEVLPSYKDNFDVEVSTPEVEETLPRKLPTIGEMFSVESEEEQRKHAHYIIDIKDNFDLTSQSDSRDTTPRVVTIDIKDNFDLIFLVTAGETELRKLNVGEAFNITSELESELHDLTYHKLSVSELASLASEIDVTGHEWEEHKIKVDELATVGQETSKKSQENVSPRDTILLVSTSQSEEE